jgi:sialate O-acetylesterase
MLLRMLLLVAVASATTFPKVSDKLMAGDETLHFLSSTLGDHMVLQRAPQQAVVWGFTTAGATITTTFNGQSLSSTADSDGTWRQKLPATKADGKAYSLTFQGSAGETASLSDVLFGDVFICSGQSNMAFSMPGLVC